MNLIDQLEALVNNPKLLTALQRRKELREKQQQVRVELHKIQVELRKIGAELHEMDGRFAAPRNLGVARQNSFSTKIRAVLMEGPMTSHDIHERLVQRGYTASSPYRVQKTLSAWKSIGKATNDNGTWSLTVNAEESK